MIGINMQDIRRFKLRLLIRDKFGNERDKFLKASGLSKGRLSQIESDQHPFGERAARNLEDRLTEFGIQPGYFDTLDERTLSFAMAFERLPAHLKDQWEQLAAMLGTPPRP